MATFAHCYTTLQPPLRDVFVTLSCATTPTAGPGTALAYAAAAAGLLLGCRTTRTACVHSPAIWKCSAASFSQLRSYDSASATTYWAIAYNTANATRASQGTASDVELAAIRIPAATTPAASIANGPVVFLILVVPDVSDIKKRGQLVACSERSFSHRGSKHFFRRGILGTYTALPATAAILRRLLQ